MSVDWVRVGDVLELKRRAVEPELDQTYREVGVRSFGRGLFVKESRSGAEIGEKRVFAIEPGDLVVSNVFAWEGAVAVAGDEAEGTIGSHRFMTWSPNGNHVVHVPFISHFFASDVGLELLRAASPGSAGRNRTLSIRNLEAIRVPLPSIDEQRRIAAHLDEVAAVVQQGRMNRSADALLHSLVRSALDAPRLHIGELLRMDRQWVDLDDDERYRAIGVRGFGRGLIKYPAVPQSQLSKMRYFDVQPLRLLVSNIKAWEGAVTHTSVADVGLVGSNRFLQYEVLSPDVSLDWAYAYLSSPWGTAALSAASPGSADRNRTLSIRSFESIEMPVPDMQVQERVADVGKAMQRFTDLARRKDVLVRAMLPAARNEIFTAMR
ncbi:MAG: restriction endonuclease subunit S [Tomitella sp.]|nr:restriction endonuclease subunit S [Tomitella sp.]